MECYELLRPILVNQVEKLHAIFYIFLRQYLTELILHLHCLPMKKLGWGWQIKIGGISLAIPILNKSCIVAISRQSTSIFGLFKTQYPLLVGNVLLHQQKSFLDI